MVVAGGNDVLQSGPGRDVPIGGSGASQLFGSLSGPSVLIAGAFSQQYNIATLQALSSAWFGANPAAAVQAILGSGVTPGSDALPDL